MRGELVNVWITRCAPSPMRVSVTSRLGTKYEVSAALWKYRISVSPFTDSLGPLVTFTRAGRGPSATTGTALPPFDGQYPLPPGPTSTVPGARQDQQACSYSTVQSEGTDIWASP